MNLSVKNVYRQAYRLLVGSPGLFVSTLLIPGILLLVIGLFSIYLRNGEVDAVDFILTAIYYYTVTVFAITCHRLVILGDGSVPVYGQLSWSNREWRFVGLFLVVGLTLLAGFLLGWLPFVFLGTVLASKSKIWLIPLVSVAVVCVFGATYYAARISLILPACAIDKRLGIRESMVLTENNGWKMVFIVFGMPFVLALVTDLLKVNSTIFEYLFEPLWVIVYLFEVTLLSMAYKELSSGKLDTSNHEQIV